MSQSANEAEKDEDGLTEHEREYLTTSVSQLSPEDRLIAISIREKRDNNRWVKNAAERAADAKVRREQRFSNTAKNV